MCAHTRHAHEIVDRLGSDDRWRRYRLRPNVNVAATITPEKLRRGEPEALAAVCDRRGAAVFEYCRKAAGPEAAVEAAAEASRSFAA